MQFQTLVEAVAYWAEKTPDKTCLIEAETDRQLTYGEFWRLIRVFARRLKETGLQTGDRVVVRVGPLLETFVAQFGIYLAGGVYCPVEKHMKSLKMLEMLDYYDCTLLITSERVEYDGSFIELGSVCEDGEPLAEYAFPNPEDMCAIVFTTGTTGKAKGVMLSNKAAKHMTYCWENACGFEPNEVFMIIHPLDRPMSILATGAPFVAGGCAVYHSGTLFANDLFAQMKLYGATFIYFTAPIAVMLLEANHEAFLSIADQPRAMFFGAGKLNDKHKSLLKTMLPKPRLFSQYGATEVAPITMYEFGCDQRKPNCVGKPVGNTNISFISSDMQPTEATAQNPGILVCGNSDGLMLGYWKDLEMTASVLRDGHLVTTDMGFMDEAGYVYLLGRRDDVMVSGGFKVAPYEIEEAAVQIPGIAECACVAAPNKVLGSIPELYVVMKPGAEFSAKAILDQLKERLETFKLPRMIFQLDALPRIENSYKIDRRRLKDNG